MNDPNPSSCTKMDLRRRYTSVSKRAHYWRLWVSILCRFSGCLYRQKSTRCLLRFSFYGFYRDDGLNVIDGKKTIKQLVKWLENFHAKVNELTGSDCLKFTLDIWYPDSPKGEETGNEKVSINQDPKFPYLDMELYWRESALQFRVHLKPNQQLK